MVIAANFRHRYEYYVVQQYSRVSQFELVKEPENVLKGLTRFYIYRKHATGNMPQSIQNRTAEVDVKNKLL